jgi:hypothetical protein
MIILSVVWYEQDVTDFCVVIRVVLVTTVWFAMCCMLVIILWFVELCVSYHSLMWKPYLTKSNISLLQQRMPDMSNLHEVQMVDMLPSDMNAELQQVKLSSYAVILIFLHAQTISCFLHPLFRHYFFNVIKCHRCPFYFTQAFSLLSHCSTVITGN